MTANSTTAAADKRKQSSDLLRVIFLDCDGVLANSRSACCDYETGDETLIHDPLGWNVPLEKSCVLELQRIARTTRAVVILSTTWRLESGMRKFLVSSLEQNGVGVIGDTPSQAQLPKSSKRFGRGAEVATWLSAHEGRVESFVILDDDHANSFAQAGLDHAFVQTTMSSTPASTPEERMQEGLTPILADKAIRILLDKEQPPTSKLKASGHDSASAATVAISSASTRRPRPKPDPEPEPEPEHVHVRPALLSPELVPLLKAEAEVSIAQLVRRCRILYTQLTQQQVQSATTGKALAELGAVADAVLASSGQQPFALLCRGWLEIQRNQPSVAKATLEQGLERLRVSGKAGGKTAAEMRRLLATLATVRSSGEGKGSGGPPPRGAVGRGALTDGMPMRRNAAEGSAALKRAKLGGPQAEMRGVIEWLLALPEAERLSLQEAELTTFGSFHPESSWVMTASGPVTKKLGHDEPPLEVVFAPRYSVPGRGSPTLAATLDCGVVECAELLCERRYRPAVLNFAHGYNAGGGFEHAEGSQEEALMRRTSLFLSLWPHRRHDDGAGVLTRGSWIGDFDSALPRRQPYYPHSSAGGIYSPHVCILPRGLTTHRGGEAKAYPKVGVLSVAAQDVKREPPFQPALLREKIRTVLHLAASHGHDAVVLGAFGCGYFANPRAEVVATFKELLEGEFSHAFRFVGFAVPRNRKAQAGGKTFNAFADAFPVLDLAAVPPIGELVALSSEACGLIRTLSQRERARMAAAEAAAQTASATTRALDIELTNVQQQIKQWHATAEATTDGELVAQQPNVVLRVKVKGANLLPHEKRLLQSGALHEATHAGASSIWLEAPSMQLTDPDLCLVYRPMGDPELKHLLQNGVLPDTQPYQTIVEGKAGRKYAEKYLRGLKKASPSRPLNSTPSTVVEFVVPRTLVQQLFAMQTKIEDGALSHGLGDKGGNGLPLFNACLRKGRETGAAGSFRIVLVKRTRIKKK